MQIYMHIHIYMHYAYMQENENVAGTLLDVIFINYNVV